MKLKEDKKLKNGGHVVICVKLDKKTADMIHMKPRNRGKSRKGEVRSLKL